MATLSQALAVAFEHYRAGQQAAAEEVCRRIVAAEPECGEAWHLRGTIELERGDAAAAAASLQRAVAIRPAEPALHHDLGNARQLLRQWEAAEAAYRQALTLRPEYPEAEYGRARALRWLGRFDEAEAACRQALNLKPAFAEAWLTLGNIWEAQGRWNDAADVYGRAIQVRPDYAAAYNNVGAVLVSLGRLSEAEAALRRATELEPGLAAAHENLGSALDQQGRISEAVAVFRRGLELAPAAASCWSNYLLGLQYLPGIGPAELAEAHGQWEARIAHPLRDTWRPHRNPPTAERPLRLGFVSQDLGSHPVGHFLVPVVENIDRQRFPLFYYNGRTAKDDLTARIAATACGWCDVWGMSDEELADRIRGDAIDVLFDLDGHTGQRLGVFARKPAPLQVAWIGYPGTTGLTAMDYLLADGFEIPPVLESNYRESVLRMPNGYVCFEPPADAPAVGPLPAVERGWVTFGSFNNLGKVNATVVSLWSTVLRQVPRSRLLLKYRGLDNAAVADRLREVFAKAGVEDGQLILEGGAARDAMLANYGRVDIGLDPLPYNGGLTTCEALWMGVPVVTCPGETFAGRHSLSHLSNMGFTETIARDLDEYVRIAGDLAGDLPRLAAIRARLRDQTAGSALCDGRRFADDLMRLLSSAWREWCERMKDEG